MPSRLKREECRRTKHDSIFSSWEILIGPNDWENHSLGKDGVERYRIHNLPIRCSCPGLYELGVAAVPIDGGHNSRKHLSDDIVVLYLGQADNVRTRLQHYGRAGSHLDHGNSINFSSKSGSPSLQRGPGLFKEVFSRSYSIMFRWAPMMNKKEAENTEAQLLGIFDYAWNTRGNGPCRREDILLKLDNSVTSPLLRKLHAWRPRAFVRKVGIKINSNKSLDECALSGYLQGSLIPQVHKIIKTQPRSVERDDSLYRDHDFCGVASGDGSICRNRPVSGRKRCEQHKGKKITGTNSVTSCIVTSTTGHSYVCGVRMEDGHICMESPAPGRMRCELHKGRRIADSEPHKLPKEKLFNEVGILFNNNCPFENHQGQRPKGAKSVMGKECWGTKGNYDLDEKYNTCGFVSDDGYVCRRKPVSGRKRCQEHKGRRITGTPLGAKSVMGKECWGTKGNYDIHEEYNTCGYVSDDGYVCRRKPVSGRKRCQEHKGRRIRGTCLILSSEGLGTRRR